ncbi:MAG TPA: carbonic anhydrase [Prolixibacteraceae bacterium]|nr:carbonic anhydrase [Prolixibacteraceae bacterium]
MDKLIPIECKENIPHAYRDTPIGQLLEYHNLGRPFDTFMNAKLLVGMCMDNRKHLIMPDNFAFVIRSGGANLQYSEFKVSYAIAVGKVEYIALIGHNNCGMVNINARKKEFVDGLINIAGWTKDSAENHFKHFTPMFEIGNEIDFILSETKRLRLRYPGIKIAPMFYLVENNKLYFIEEN